MKRLWWLLCLASAGCANAGLDASEAGTSDAGTAVGSDARPPAESGETARADSTFLGCLDGSDADGDTLLDCADDECGVAPVCCVGATSGACCRPASPVLTVSLADCGGTCAPVETDVFGAPVLDASGFHPAASDADEGLLFAAPIDVRRGAASMSATITAPPVAGRALDVVTFGLSAGEGSARMLPRVAAQVNAVTRRVSILVGETVVGAAPLVGEAEITYTLSLSPSGTVVLTGGASELRAEGVPVDDVLFPTVYGRTEGTGPAASARTLAVATERCDVPSALTPEPIVVVDEAISFVAGTEANPSLAVDGSGVRWLAFDAVRRDDPTRRGVFVAVQTGPLEFTVRNPGVGESQPVLGPSLDVEQFTEPDLMLEGGRWVLYVAGEANGVESIFRADAVPGAGLSFRAPVEIPIEGLVGSLDAPARMPGTSGRIYARARDEAGRSSIVELRIGDGVAGAIGGDFADGICGVDDVCESETSRDARFILAARGDGSFDSDEVDAPSLVSLGGVVRLYYAGRRGTRWVTSMVVSEDGAYWRRTSETSSAPDVVLGPDEELSPLGARGASVLVEADALTVIFEGYRGTRSQLLMARQPR